MNSLNHVAIIVDGNGRWAKEKGLARSDGHYAGFKNLEKLILHVSEKNIKMLSLYVFSTENFKRDKNEVDYLMNLFIKGFTRVKKKYKDKNIKIIFSGEENPLPKEVYKKMKELENETKNNTGLIVNFCLNYGGRREIVSASKKIAELVKNNKLNIDDINEELFSKYLYNLIPDVDLLIRTSGEKRLSNFLLWEISYAELVFTKTYFPDFTMEEFDLILEEYNNRDRRFGGINKKS